ncbi:MAG: stage V sporulation protein AB [Hespellia sp.]|nr:stage V sporulation protein AB [Hespellia sp.]
MWIRQLLLGILGLSFGIAAAGGLFAFIVGLGVVSDLADRTQTADHILFYEDSIAMGGILGNVFMLFHVSIPGGGWIVPVFGLLSGIFVGCWAMALAEILNLFPILIRRVKIIKGIPWFILAMALGKGIGSCLFYFLKW